MTHGGWSSRWRLADGLAAGLQRWRRFPSLFLGATLDDGAQAEAQVVELLTDGLYGRQLLIRVSFAFDELLADFGCRQTTIQLGGLERGISLEQFGNEITNVLK